MARFAFVVGLIAFASVTLSPVAAPAEQGTSLDRCISAIAGDVSRYLDKASKCLRNCEDGRRTGAVPESVRCRRPSNHAPTQACLLRAVEQISGSKSVALRRCDDDEVALFYGGTGTCPGSNDNVAGILQCLARKSEKALQKLSRTIYQPERPPVCGDGAISGSEQCDPNAFPNGCSFSDFCHPQFCFCISPGCGNGFIEAGEDCDYGAFPNGCSFGDFCDFGCICEGPGSASRAFLSSSSDLLE